MGATAIIGLLAPLFTDMIKRIFPDKEKQAEAELKMNELLMKAQAEAAKAEQVTMEAKKEVLITEMNTNSWFSDWRAKLMTMCTLMIGFNWLIVPVLNSLLYFLGTQITSVPIPSEAWVLVNIGLGGYIGEKTMQTYQQGKVDKAIAENPNNDKAFYDTLRSTMFKSGMTQEQVTALQNALNARDKGL